MASSELPIPPDVLLNHSAGLRSMAFSLLGDEHAAEDVVQDTWVTALERPPRVRSRMGGWLRNVTRGLAINRRRGEGRRAQRELDAAREEGLASVDEVLAEREVLRQVVDAVLALEEPYQSVVFMRYYQDLSPRAIAEQRGVPLATVESQLHRARTQLRRRLDSAAGGSRGQWALALASATGWKRGGAPDPAASSAASAAEAGRSGTLAGGIGMEWIGAVGISVVAAAAIGLSGSEPPAAQGTGGNAVGAGVGAQVARAEVVAPEQAGAADGPRVARQESRETAVDPGQVPLVPGTSMPSFSYRVDGRVLLEDGLPAVNATLYAGTLRQPLNTFGTTDPDGRFSLSFRGTRPQMTLALWIRQSNVPDSGVRLLDLRAGRTHEVELRLLRSMSGEMADLKAQLQAKALHAHKQAQNDEERLAVLGDLQQQALILEEHAARMTGRKLGITHGAVGADSWPGRFFWPSEVWTWDAVEMIEESVGQVDLGPGAGQAGMLAGLGYAGPSAPKKKKPTVELSGRVSNADGTPAAGAAIILDGTRPIGRTDDEGRYSVRLTVGRELHLRAGGGQHGVAARALDLSEAEEGQSFEWSCTLDRGTELKGRLLGPEGEPLDKWIVEFVTDGGAVHQSTALTEAGAFALPNLPKSAGEVHVYPLDRGVFFPVRTFRVQPGGGDVELAVAEEDLGHGELRVALVDANGEPLQRTDVIAIHEASGRGKWLRFDAGLGAYVLDQVPAGRYRIVGGGQRSGVSDLGYVTVDPEQVAELGPVQPAAPARLKLTFSGGTPDELRWTLARTSDGASALVHHGTVGEPFEAQLPAGTYEVSVTGAGFSGAARRLELAAGTEHDVVHDLTPAQQVTLHFVGAGEEEELRWTLLQPGAPSPIVREQAMDAGRLHLWPGEYQLHVQVGARTLVHELRVADAPVDEVVDLAEPR